MTTKDFAKSLGMTTTKAFLMPERYRESLEKQGLRYSEDGTGWMPDLTSVEFISQLPSKQCHECGTNKSSLRKHYKGCYINRT